MDPLTVESIRNIHAGRPCIITGTGPSLRHLSPERTQPFVVIAINSTILKFPHADYFFSCDAGVTLQKSWYSLKNLACKIIIARPKTLEGFGAYDYVPGKEPHMTGIDPSRVVYIYRKPETGSLAVHPSDSEIIFGQSSAHCAFHTAYLMGCRPIILVGCDCGWEDGKRYHYEFKEDEAYADDLARPELAPYFHPPEKDTVFVTQFLDYWNKIGADNPNVEILNCSNAVIPNIQPAKLKDVLEAHHG